MSSEKISSNEKPLNNLNIFLGKKIEFLEKCKICQKKENLTKCIKCSNYYCNDCLKNVFKIPFEEIKSAKYICLLCLKKNENIINKSLNINKCFLCNKQLNENNFTCYNATKEQKDKLKNEIIKITNNKEISLIEEDENNKLNEIKNINQKFLIKICNECNIINEEIIGKIFLLKNNKDELNHKKIMDELTNLIKKENGNNNINIFDILENKFEKTEETSKDNNVTKKKQKDLFESIVINKTEKEKNNNIIKTENRNVINNINKIQDTPVINVNSNNKTSNIYLPNFFSIAQLQTNQNPSNQFTNQNISKNVLNMPNIKKEINPQNDINIKPNINQAQNNINNILNDINDMYNKINNSSQNLKDIKESINNLTNINNPNNIGAKSSIKETLNKISNCLYNFDINNIENNLNIINKIESLTNLISDIINEEKKGEKNEEINKETPKEEKLCININKNYKEIISNIHSTTESLKNQLKTLKAYTEMKKIYSTIIYQNIDKYLKEMNTEKNDKNISKINNNIPPPNINNMIPLLNPINPLNNNLQGINLLNNIDINALSNNLIFPISPILTNNNNLTNSLPIFNPKLNIPNLLSQARLNSLGNPLFQ